MKNQKRVSLRCRSAVGAIYLMVKATVTSLRYASGNCKCNIKPSLLHGVLFAAADAHSRCLVQAL